MKNKWMPENYEIHLHKNMNFRFLCSSDSIFFMVAATCDCANFELKSLQPQNS